MFYKLSYYKLYCKHGKLYINWSSWRRFRKRTEDEDEEVESKKKRRRLAEIIINFISKNDYQTEDETEILLSLFEYPTDKQAEELKQLATNIEPIALARDVVEDRIDDLTYQVNEQPVKSEISDEKTEQIIALKEIRDYLSTSSEVTSNCCHERNNWNYT